MLVDGCLTLSTAQFLLFELAILNNLPYLVGCTLFAVAMRFLSLATKRDHIAYLEALRTDRALDFQVLDFLLPLLNLLIVNAFSRYF